MANELRTKQLVDAQVTELMRLGVAGQKTYPSALILPTVTQGSIHYEIPRFDRSHRVLRDTRRGPTAAIQESQWSVATFKKEMWRHSHGVVDDVAIIQNSTPWLQIRQRNQALAKIIVDRGVEAVNRDFLINETPDETYAAGHIIDATGIGLNTDSKALVQANMEIMLNKGSGLYDEDSVRIFLSRRSKVAVLADPVWAATRVGISSDVEPTLDAWALYVGLKPSNVLTANATEDSPEGTTVQMYGDVAIMWIETSISTPANIDNTFGREMWAAYSTINLGVAIKPYYIDDNTKWKFVWERYGDPVALTPEAGMLFVNTVD